MLYGIISDIHGNLEALSAVLAQIKQVDKIICSGDLVGYGPNPNECVEKIKTLKINVIAGNHDKALTGELGMTWFNERAKLAIDLSKNLVSLENLEYLKSLPLQSSDVDFQIVHGGLEKPLEEYVRDIATSLPTFKLMDKPLCFVGHWHRPSFVALKKDGNYEGRLLLEEEELLIDDFEKIIINPGAVGQPRDRDKRASYGLYNSKTKLFSLHRVEYDIAKTQEKMKTLNFPQQLIDRLALGKYGQSGDMVTPLVVNSI